MKYLLYSLLIAILIFAVSCTGKKFDYEAAYKFSTPQTEQKHKLEKPNNQQLLATSEEIITVIKKPDFNNDLSSEMGESKSKLSSPSKREEILENLSKKERKIVEKVEKRIKRKLESKPAAKSMDGRVYTGIIIGAAGLVLMILAGGTVGSIGALALLVGVIFIVWGLLDQ